MLHSNMAIASTLKISVFFCDMNEERWQATKEKLNYSFNDTIWLTEDQRVDKDEMWFNILIKR